MYTASQWLALVLSIGVCAIAVTYVDYFSSLIPTQSSGLSEAEQAQVLSSFLYQVKDKQVGRNEAGKSSRLAFCCSADLDVSVRAVELMTQVQRLEEEQVAIHTKKKSSHKKYQTTLKREHHERIAGLRELQESFAFYFANGAAAEQSMSSPEQFREVVKIANEQKDVKHKVGGNAATMADRASIEGCDVMLGAAIGKEMRKHFNSDIRLVGHLEDHEHEDVHLVLEYSKGDAFRGHESPRANRYYLNHDIYNARLSVLEEFESALHKFNPDIVIIGGLQLMEVETDEQRRLERLIKLSEVLQNLYRKHTPSHYEFAAVSDFTLFDDTVRLVLPWVDSIGLNEQELYILHHFLVTGEEGTATNSRPSVAQVTEQISEVIGFANKAREEHDRIAHMDARDLSRTDMASLALGHLSRIHFHTLQFHIICQRQESAWEDPTIALIQSALMSSKLACGKNNSDPSILIPSADMEIDPARIEVLLPRHVVVSKKQSIQADIDPFSPIITWQEHDFQCHLAPMVACKKPDHTAGLGDNISGTGIAYHGRKQQPPATST